MWKMIIVIFSLLLTSISAYSLEELNAFPRTLNGVWVYESGNENIDGCNALRISVNKSVITVVENCLDHGRSVNKYRIKEVLVDRAFFSKKIDEYHVLTDGPNVVFDILSNSRTSSVYLQFWVTDDYGPTKQLGVFNLR